jgi:hypothetical protein
MRALLLAALLLLGGAAAPAQATPDPVRAMDYWHYIATYATEEECEEEGAKIPEGVDYYVCWPTGDAWEFYWVFLT